MNRIVSQTLFVCLFVTTLLACKKEDSASDHTALPSENTTPAELLETEWLLDKFAVWNGYRIYHSGEFYNPSNKVWYSGKTDAADLDPDCGTGLYFGSKRFVSTIVTSFSSGGGCRTNNAFYTEGVPEFKGNRITFYPAVKRGRSKSVCSPGDDYDRDFSAAKEEYTWNLGVITDPDGYGYYTLTLTNDNNQSTTFYRRR